MLCSVHLTSLLGITITRKPIVHFHHSYLGLDLGNRLFLFAGCKGTDAAAFQVYYSIFLKTLLGQNFLLFLKCICIER